MKADWSFARASARYDNMSPSEDDTDDECYVACAWCGCLDRPEHMDGAYCEELGCQEERAEALAEQAEESDEPDDETPDHDEAYGRDGDV